MGFINPVKISDTRTRRGWWRRGLVVTALAASALVAPPLLPPAQALPFCDDAPAQVGFATNTYTVAEDQATLDIQVSRLYCIGGLQYDVAVNWAVTGGTASARDYGGEVAGTLTWSWDDFTDRVVPLTIINDTTPESDETVIVTLTPGDGTTLITTAETSVTISANDNTSPRIARVRPVPGSVVRDRTPLIAAKVTDRETNLSARAIRLFVDGRSRSFTYDRATDRLQRISGMLTLGRHTVRVRAEDPQGVRTVRTWAFRVGR